MPVARVAAASQHVVNVLLHQACCAPCRFMTCGLCSCGADPKHHNDATRVVFDGLTRAADARKRRDAMPANMSEAKRHEVRSTTPAVAATPRRVL